HPGSAGPFALGPQPGWPEGAKVRTKVTGPDGVMRYMYGASIDLAAGPGPSRQLPEHVLDARTLKEMRDAGVFHYGDQSFTPEKLGRGGGGEVANLGGGASGAWGTEAGHQATAEGRGAKRVTDMEWFGRSEGVPKEEIRRL